MKRDAKSESKSRKPRRGGRSMRPNPPMLTVTPVLTRKFRLTATAAEDFTKVYNTASLIGIAGGICTVANNSVYAMFSSVRLRSIECWAAVPAQGQSATVGILMLGGGTTRNMEYSDTSLSTSTLAHVRAVPSPQTINSFWNRIYTGSTVIDLFSLSVPAAAVIDITLDLMTANQENGALSYRHAPAACTISTIYYLPLDLQLGTHNILPITLATTF